MLSMTVREASAEEVIFDLRTKRWEGVSQGTTHRKSSSGRREWRFAQGAEEDQRGRRGEGRGGRRTWRPGVAGGHEAFSAMRTGAIFLLVWAVI